MRFDTFDKAEYAGRRARLMEKIGDVAAIFLGATTQASDTPFRQRHDFFPMTGVELPDAFLVVDGMRTESVLFFTTTEAAADGAAIPLDLVRTPVEHSGVERALPAEQFSSFIARQVRPARPTAKRTPKTRVESVRGTAMPSTICGQSRSSFRAYRRAVSA